MALVGGEDLEAVQRRGRVGGDLLQEMRQTRDEACGRCRIEQVGAVLEFAAEPGGLARGVLCLGEAERQVELGGAGAGGECGCVQAGQFEARLRVVLQDEHGLEQGLPAEGTRRVEDLDQALEGQVLVGVGLEAGAAGAREQFGKSRIAAGVGTQHEGVDEEADERIEGGLGATGDGGADRDVGAAAELAEQEGERGLQEHEQRGALRAGQVLELCMQRGRDRDVDGGARVTRGQRSWSVGGQRQLGGQAGELAGPVGDLAGERARGIVLVTEQGALPEGVVGVLDGQRREGGRRAVESRGIGLGQVIEERRDRSTVRGAVVDEQQERVVVGGEPEQRGPERELAGEIEAVCRGGSEVVLERLKGTGEALQRCGQCVRRQDALPGRAVLFDEQGAQALVTGEEVTERAVEGGGVEWPLKSDADRDVVVGTRALELVQEPETRLCEGQRQLCRPRLRGQWLAGPGQDMQGAGERAEHGGLEDGADRQLAAKPGADPGGEAGGHEGVAAEVEEVVGKTRRARGRGVRRPGRRAGPPRG